MIHTGSFGKVSNRLLSACSSLPSISARDDTVLSETENTGNQPAGPFMDPFINEDSPTHPDMYRQVKDKAVNVPLLGQFRESFVFETP